MRVQSLGGLGFRVESIPFSSSRSLHDFSMFGVVFFSSVGAQYAFIAIVLGVRSAAGFAQVFGFVLGGTFSHAFYDDLELLSLGLALTRRSCRSLS